MARFDPIRIAERCREGRLFAPKPEDLEGYGPTGAWQAGSAALDAVLASWWAGEGSVTDEALATAAEWFEMPAERAVPYGGDPPYWESVHRLARALCGWMAGQERPGRWSEAAGSLAALLGRDSDGAGEKAPLSLALALAMAGAGEAVPQAASPFVEGLDAELCRILAGEPTDRDTAAAIGVHLRRHGGRFFVERQDMPAAILFAFACHRSGLIERRRDCLTCCYAVIPALPLPPALIERGWSDARSGRVRFGASVRFERLDRLLLTLGFSRDPDAAPQPAPPAFASWTRQPGLESEADWHCEGGVAWLDLRGEDAGRVAGLVAETFGARATEDDAGALAGLLTVPSAASSPANAQARWQILAALVRDPGQVDMGTAEPLVTAGLRDPDWRVRMTAVWGVGVLRIGRLADAAGAAALPDLGYEGLNAEDRRTLLALRDAARDRAAGRTPGPPDREGGGPGGARRAAFVARIATLFDRLAPPPRDRHEALVMVLLRMPAPARDKIPRAWRSWMA